VSRPIVHSSDTLIVSAQRRGAAAVLVLAGALDHGTAVPSGASVHAVLAGLDAVLTPRPRMVIADLTAFEVSRFGVGLLGLIRRRAARAGVRVVLVGLSSASESLLGEARCSALYPTYPTVPVALGAVGALGASGDERLRGSRRPVPA